MGVNYREILVYTANPNFPITQFIDWMQSTCNQAGWRIQFIRQQMLPTKGTKNMVLVVPYCDLEEEQSKTWNRDANWLNVTSRPFTSEKIAVQVCRKFNARFITHLSYYEVLNRQAPSSDCVDIQKDINADGYYVFWPFPRETDKNQVTKFASLITRYPDSSRLNNWQVAVFRSILWSWIPGVFAAVLSTASPEWSTTYIFFGLLGFCFLFLCLVWPSFFSISVDRDPLARRKFRILGTAGNPIAWPGNREWVVSQGLISCIFGVAFIGLRGISVNTTQRLTTDPDTISPLRFHVSWTRSSFETAVALISLLTIWGVIVKPWLDSL